VKIKQTSKAFSNEQGMALVLVLLVLVVVSVIGMSILGIAASNVKMTTGEREYQSTYYIAESGANYMLNEIYSRIPTVYENTTSEDQFLSKFENSINLGAEITYDEFEKTFGQEPFAKIKVEKLSNNGRYKVVSAGKIDNSTRTVEKQVQLNWKPNNIVYIPLETAAYIDKTISMTGGTTITGPVKTNSPINNSITISGGSFISGSVQTFAVNPKNSISDLSKVTGTVSKISSPQTFEMPPFPSFPNYPIPANERFWKSEWNSYDVILNGALRIDNWMTDGYTLHMKNDMQFSEIKIDQDNLLNINIGDQNRNIVVNNLNIPNGDIKIIGNGKLTIYVKGDLTLGSTKVNIDKDIKKLNIYWKGSGKPNQPKNLMLGSDSEIYGSLYAEDANLTFTGGTSFKGHIITGGKKVSVGGGTNAYTQLFYAPFADFTVGVEQGGGHIWGSIVANTLKMAGGASITHDQLGRDEIPFFPVSGGSASIDIEELISTYPTREVNN